MKRNLTTLFALFIFLIACDGYAQDTETVVKIVRSEPITNKDNWRRPPPYVGNTPPYIGTLTHELTLGAWSPKDINKYLDAAMKGKETFQVYRASAVDDKLAEVNNRIAQNEEIMAARARDLERRITNLIVSTSKTIPSAVYDEVRTQLATDMEKRLAQEVGALREEIELLKLQLASIKDGSE